MKEEMEFNEKYKSSKRVSFVSSRVIKREFEGESQRTEQVNFLNF